MGSNLSCIEDPTPPLQRIQYDLTPIKTKGLPIIWLVGPPGSGRNTQAQLLAKNLEFADVRVADLLRDESKKDTDRGRIIHEGLFRNKRIPDVLVVDLVKEGMLRAVQDNCKGFIINNFPRTSKQGTIFVKEIEDVDTIVYLTCDPVVMIKRKRTEKLETSGKFDEDTLKRAIGIYTRDLRESLSRFGNKVEKVSTNELPAEVYDKIEAAISARVSTRTKITAESDYAQAQSQEGEEQETEIQSSFT